MRNIRFSLRSLFALMTVCGVMLFLGIHRFAPRDYGCAGRWGQFDVPTDRDAERQLLERVQAMAERALHVEGYAVGPGRFRAEEALGANPDLVDINYELPDRFGQYQFAFGSQNWSTWTDSSARLTNSTGEPIHVIARVNMHQRRKASAGESPKLTLRLEFRAYLDRLRMPYGNSVSQASCEAVLRRICARFEDECADGGFNLQWD